MIRVRCRFHRPCGRYHGGQEALGGRASPRSAPRIGGIAAFGNDSRALDGADLLGEVELLPDDVGGVKKARAADWQKQGQER